MSTELGLVHNLFCVILLIVVYSVFNFFPRETLSNQFDGGFPLNLTNELVIV